MGGKRRPDYYRLNREMIIKRSIEYRNRPHRIVRTQFFQYRANAKRREIPFNLSYEQFCSIIKDCCYFCGVMGRNGIDRIDSTLGYFPMNCVACCSVHNVMKMSMSSEEFINACRSVIDYHDIKGDLDIA